MRKKIEFRDENMELVKVTIEFRKVDKELVNKFTLEKYHCDLELSFTGEVGGDSGQIGDEINPRTNTQREIVELWGRFHLNGMSAGTYPQEKLVAKCNRGDFSDIPESIRDGVKESFKQISARSTYDANLYLLRVMGMDIDHGYKYGSAWLHEPLPENIEERIDELFERIEEEEDELSEELGAVFDMGAKDFEPTSEIISKVMELRNCEINEAVRFLALGMHIGCTFGDLDYDFVETGDCLYSAMGNWYYVGTDDELEEIAKERLDDDDDYIQIWKDSVYHGDYRDSFEDWKDEILRHDGWVSILNSYDDQYGEYSIGGEFICVTRS